MRRHASSTPRAERVLLGAYWALSGYGLRASRALAWLGVVLLAGSLALATGSLPETTAAASGAEPFLTRWVDALGSVLDATLFRAVEVDISGWREWVVRAVRFAGPILLAFAALSMRGRTKR